MDATHPPEVLTIRLRTAIQVADSAAMHFPEELLKAADLVRDLLATLSTGEYSEAVRTNPAMADQEQVLFERLKRIGFSLKTQLKGQITTQLPLEAYRAFVLAALIVELMEPLRWKQAESLEYEVCTGAARGVAYWLGMKYEVNILWQSYFDRVTVEHRDQTGWFYLMMKAARYDTRPIEKLPTSAAEGEPT